MHSGRLSPLEHHCIRDEIGFADVIIVMNGRRVVRTCDRGQKLKEIRTQAISGGKLYFPLTA